MRREENAVWVTIACADKDPGSDRGKRFDLHRRISLTVAAVTKRNFSVSVIHIPARETTLLKKKQEIRSIWKMTLWGNIFRKFVDIGRNSGADRGKMPDDENAAGNAKGNSGLSMEFLQKYGF